MEINFIVAFSLGIFSTIHCLGMCGGIITALSLGLPDKVKGNRKIYYAIISSYNIGRVLSYTVAGAMAGIIGHMVSSQFGSNTGYQVMRILAGVILVFLGLHIAGWVSGIKYIEGLGMKFWGKIQPVGRWFLPVDTPLKALIIGCIWGWLPCGLVYSVLLWSAASVDPVTGTLYMFCFGIGTLPGMVTAGILSGSMQRHASRAYIRKTFAIIIIIFGVISPWLQIGHHEHDDMGPEIHEN